MLAAIYGAVRVKYVGDGTALLCIRNPLFCNSARSRACDNFGVKLDGVD
jgi:hypothetical protein